MTQCEFQDFPATHILREINLEDFRSSKLPFPQFQALISVFGQFQTSNIAQKSSEPKFKPSKMQSKINFT